MKNELVGNKRLNLPKGLLATKHYIRHEPNDTIHI